MAGSSHDEEVAKTEIGFYHLHHARLEQALPRLLEIILKRGHRIILMAGSNDRVESLNEHLWTYDDRSWLPHGAKSDGYDSAQPLYLTCEEENPNGADVLVCVDGVEPAFVSSFKRVVDMFDGRDDAAVSRARGRWRGFREQGLALTYWQQSENGGWEQKA